MLAFFFLIRNFEGPWSGSVWCSAGLCPHPPRSLGWTGEGSILCPSVDVTGARLCSFQARTALCPQHSPSDPWPHSFCPVSFQTTSFPFTGVIRSQPGGQGRISVLGPPRRWEGGQSMGLRLGSGTAGGAPEPGWSWLGVPGGWGSLGSSYPPRTAGL